MTFTTTGTNYCMPSYGYGCGYGDGLTYFALNTISQNVYCTGSPSWYHNYLTPVTDLVQNANYVISVRAGYSSTYVTIWIDYNRNGVFDVATETIGHISCVSSGYTYTLPFTVSATALTGTTGLRALTNFAGAYPADPCGYNYYGNCSDFTVNIIAPVAPPSVTTTASTDVTGSSGTLNGIVNANGTATTTSFQYGLTASYGSTVTAVPSFVTGSSDTPISASISGLSPNTTYHYRAVGLASGITTYGGDMTFTTNAIPPTVTTTAANTISGTSATLTGTVNANNSISSVTFEYGLTAAYGSSLSATPLSVSGNTVQSVIAGIVGLSLNTTYHYRAVSTNSAGTTYGNDMTFTTLVTQYCIPAFSTGCDSYNMGLAYFGLNTIDQAISCSGIPSYYHDFTSSSTDLHKNGAYTISLVAGYGYNYVTVWIDYNHNNIFDGASEVIGQAACYNAGATYTIPITDRKSVV